MQTGVLKLGQFEPESDEAVWLFITAHDGRYVLWGADQDEEFRDLFGIPTSAPLPRVRVRRWGNADRVAFERKKLRRLGRLSAMSDKVATKVTRESVARHVLVDWDGIAPPGEGAVQPYTPERGMDAFDDDRDFFEAITQASTDAEYFRSAAVADDADDLGN